MCPASVRLFALLSAAQLCFPAVAVARQPAAPSLTLAAAIDHAKTSSPRRGAAVAIAQSAGEAARTAGRLPNPVFELRSENWSPSSTLQRDLFAVATQYVELGGKRTLRRRIADADRDVAQASLASLERAIALDTVQAYIRALRARALVDTLTAHREGISMLVEVVSARVQEGHTAEADLLKFRTEAARNDGDIARARLELERSLAALAIVIGSASPIAAGALSEPAPLTVPSADAATIAAAVSRHPSIRAAEAARARSVQLTAAERARRVPDAAVSAGYKRTAGIDTLVLGIAMSVPIFDRNDTAVARAFGAERAAIADRDALVQQLSADAASLVRAAAVISLQAATASDQLLGPAEEVRNAALASFREGGADVLRVIDAERVFTDVRRAAVDLRLDALLTTIEARYALGEDGIP